MPPAYTVRAQVVDIRSDKPQATDCFLVDSNVWFWSSYSLASQRANRYQMRYYPAYLTRTVAVKARRFRIGLSFAEVAHLIEGNERDSYMRKTNTVLSAKEYRHNFPAERARVAARVQSVWGAITSLSDPLDIRIDDALSNAALRRLQSQPLDGYDLFILEAMNQAGIGQVLTDDGDYCSVPGMEVFTANHNVILAAAAQNKLLVR